MRWGAGWLWLFSLALWPASSLPAILRVPDDYPTIAAALENAPPGTIIRISAGEYSESLVIEKPMILDGGGKATLYGSDDTPAITIADTGGVVIQNLAINGGQYGILVTRSRNVTIRNNVITGSRLVGIKVRQASADISGNTISDARPPYGKGIHITNTMEWPLSTIENNVVRGNAMTGVATNMAVVSINGNVVTDNGQAGIAVTEMSHAVVLHNTVQNNDENGILISDQSKANVCNNDVSQSQPSITAVGPRYGNGITIDFYSQVTLQGNIIADNSNNGISVLVSSSVQNGDNTIDRNTGDSVWLDDTSQSDSTIISGDMCRELSR